MKRLLAALAASIGVLGIQASTASAYEYFCDWDPTVVVITPAGNVDAEYLSVYTASPLRIGLPLSTATATRAYDVNGNPVTDVDVAIYIPGGLLGTFKTYNVVSSGLLGSGKILATSYGSSGTVSHVHYRIDRP